LLLDVGPLSCYNRSSVYATKVLITHFHHDHWSGLISLLGLKKCRDEYDPVHIFLPKGAIGFLESLLAELKTRRELSIGLVAETELSTCAENVVPVVLHPLDKNQTIETNDGLMIGTFSVVHRNESLGFKLSTRKENDSSWRRLLTYTGDTNLSALLDEDVLSSPVLITECTYLGPDKTEKAEERSHMSLSGIVEVEQRFKGDSMLLIHFKANYTDEEIARSIDSYRFNRVRRTAICTKISDSK
jgi:ribonuclease BN (tRNA processing enzyme)